MKKITLLILTLLLSITGYSQLALEGFESTTGPDALPSTNWTLGTGNWAVFDNGTGLGIRWGINTANVCSGAQIAYANREFIGLGNTSEDYLATPLVTIPANGELHFKTRSFTPSNQGTIYQVKVAPATAVQTNPASYTLVQQWTEVDLTAVYNVCEEKIVNLNAFAGQQVYVSFVKIFTQPTAALGGDRWLVDDVSINTRCLEPTALVAGNVNVDSATLNWANPSGATSWEIEVVQGAAGVPTGIGVIYNGLPPYVVSGLLPITSYKFYVRALCSTGYTSIWAGPSEIFTTTVAPPECGGNFLDSGAIAADYSTNENITTTICPTANPLQKVTVTFNTFDTEEEFDGLYVYNGNAAVLTSLIPSTNPAANVPGGIAGSYWGTTIPGPFTSTSADGCLTFVFRSDGFVTNPGWTSSITCALPPACQQPTTLTTANITTTSVQLGWNSPGTATLWQVIAVAQGSPAPLATETGWTAAPTNPFTLGGLIPGTVYDYYVRGNCGTTDGVSLWSGPVTFSTVPTCPPPASLTVSAVLATSAQLDWPNVNPSVSWQVLALICGSPAPNAASTGWFPSTTNSYLYTALLPTTCYDFYVRGVCSDTDISFWTPVTSATTQALPPVCGGNFVDSGGTTGDYSNSEDITTTICPDAANPTYQVTVTFTAFSTEANWDGLYVFDGNSITAPQIPSANGPGNVPGGLAGSFWGTTIPGPFTSSSVDGCLTFRFRSDASVFRPGWITDIICTPAPTCRKPNALTATTVTSTEIIVEWNQFPNPDTSVATAWQILVLPCGSPEPTAASTGFIDNVTGSPFTILNLTPNTCYDIYIRAVCSPTDSSVWVGIENIRTQCVPFSIPFQEGFNTDSTSEECWTVLNVNNDDDTWNLNDAANPYEGNQAASLNTEGGASGTNNDWLISPQIGGLNGNQRLRYRYRVLSDFEPNDFRVMLSTTGAAPANFTQTLVPLATYSNEEYVENIVQLTGITGTVNIAFHVPAGGLDGWVLYFDKVIVETNPSCIEPSALVVINTTSTSANLGWTDNNTPSATQWEVLILPAGSAEPLPGLPVGTGIIVNSNPALITGLDASSEFVFFVRAICSATDNSNWSTGLNFSTKPDNDECENATFVPVNSSAVCNQIASGVVSGASASGLPALIAPCIGTPDDDVWFQFIATNAYLNVSLQNIQGSTTDLNFAVYSGTCTALTQFACSDAFSISDVLNDLTVGDLYFIRVYSNSAAPQTVSFDLCISTPSTCENSATVCEAQYGNTTGVDTLGQIGCLFTSPNPTFFTIQVTQTGPINYLLTQSTTLGGAPNLDVDYAAWGPFTSQSVACSAINLAGGGFLQPGIGVPLTQQTGCSYSFLPTENLNIVNAQAGQFYVILITNFSDDPGFISLTQTNIAAPGAGQTTCCSDAAFEYNEEDYCKLATSANPVATILPNSLAGVFTSFPAGLVFVDTATGEVNLQASAPGYYQVTNTLAATTSCIEKVYFYFIRITEPQSATITYPITEVCENDTATILVTITGETGGTFSVSPNGGLFINTDNGTITPSLSAPGIYTITYELSDNAPCPAPAGSTATIVIKEAVIPSFTQVAPICPGETLADLPTNSNDTVPISGTWSPAINNTTTTVYTFTPNDGSCSTVALMTIEVGSVTPAFDQVASICVGDILANLPTTSENGVVGSWSPAMDNTVTTVYTFTPNTGICAGQVTMTIEVLAPSIVPTFTNVAPICPNGILLDLPTSSNNTIPVTGIWTPALNNTATTVYTFTPDAGQCALSTTITIIVNPELFVTVNSPSFCPGSSTTVTATPSIPGTYTYTWTVPTGVADPGNVPSFVTSTVGDYSVVITQVNNFCNTDFESPTATGAFPNLFAENLVDCWDTTSSDGIIEIWPPGFEGVLAYSGNQLIELNGNVPGTLFQDFSVIPGTSISVSFAHRGRQGNDVVGVEIGPIGGPFVSLGNFTDNTTWNLHSVNYTIPTGSGNDYTLRFVSVSSSGGSPSIGNLLDAISISSLSCPSQAATGTVSLQTIPAPTVTVTQPTCAVQTGTIEVTSPISGGGIAPTDLYISEVTDAAAGSLSYIEIYNGTSSAKDLSNYKIQVYNNGNSTISTNCDIALSGMLNSNTVYVLAIGENTNQGGVVPNLTVANCGAINTNDNVKLVSSSDVVIDSWGRTDGVDFTPSNQSGYTYRRLNTATTVPSTTWIETDWTALDPEDYTNVGSYSSLNTVYQYSLDSGTYQTNTTFSGVIPGNHTITVQNMTTGCFSLPFDVLIDAVPQFPSVTTFSYTTPVCQNAATNPTPDTSAVGFTSGGTYTSSTGIAINSSTGEIDLTNTIAGSYDVTYEVVYNATTCQVAGSSMFTIVINPAVTPVTSFTYTTPVCQNGTNPTPTPGTGFAAGGSYTSTAGLSIDATTGIINLSLSTAGTYTVTYSVNSNPSSCLIAGSTPFEIIINPVVTPVTTFSYTTPVCSGGTNPTPIPSAGFTAGGTYTSTTGLVINGTTGEIDLALSSSGTYTVTYSVNANAAACQSAQSSPAVIVISNPIQVSVDGDCQGVNYTIVASPVNGSFDPNTVTYLWEDSTGLAIGGNTQSIIVTNPDTYTVTVVSNGCSGTDDFPIDAITCVIQKGISPNNDSLNDFFDLEGLNVKNLGIFNRYGTKVYGRSNYTNQWKGQSDKGDELPDGTYYYVIERDNGETKTGWIYINREL